MKRKMQPAVRSARLWQRAALLASLWAAIEIVVGSFLHNLRIPLSGTLLAAAGVFIMIRGYRMWPEPGLLWRTALVTAAMKSISPSAIILGPMVGIFMEGFWMELMLRLWRGRWPAFLLGGALAVSWSLIQKALVLLITFGWNIMEIYHLLYSSISRKLGVDDFGALDLVLLVFIIDLCFGAIVGGLSYGIQFHETAHHGIKPILGDPTLPNPLTRPVEKEQRYSLGLLILNLVLLPLGFLAIRSIPMEYSAALLTLYVVWNAHRYRRSQARLRRPRFWIGMILIMLLSGLALGVLNPSADWRTGILAGVDMIIRAILIIFFLSALSIEIRNPRILKRLSSHGLGPFLQAVSAGFSTLPAFAGILAEQRGTWRNPRPVIQLLFDTLQVSDPTEKQPQVMITLLTADQGAGKTSFLQGAVERWRQEGVRVGGFLSLGVGTPGQRESYDLLDLTVGTRIQLCQRSETGSGPRTGSFQFSESALAKGNSILREPGAIDLLVVDEVGPLELGGDGWWPALVEQMDTPMNQIWVVRSSLVEEVRDRINRPCRSISLEEAKSTPSLLSH